MKPHRSRSDAFQVFMEGWISTGTRLLGFVGIGYEMFVDKLRNPGALFIFGALATAKDVLQYRQIIKESAGEPEEGEDDAKRRPRRFERRG